MVEEGSGEVCWLPLGWPSPPFGLGSWRQTQRETPDSAPTGPYLRREGPITLPSWRSSTGGVRDMEWMGDSGGLRAWATSRI